MKFSISFYEGNNSVPGDLSRLSGVDSIFRKSGTERSVRRQRSSNPPLPPPATSDPEPEPELDPRECAVIEHSDTAHQLFQSILPLLFEVLNATSGCNVQQKCLQTIIRMVRVAECDVIKAVLHDVPVSNYRHILFIVQRNMDNFSICR